MFAKMTKNLPMHASHPPGPQARPKGLQVAPASPELVLVAGWVFSGVQQRSAAFSSVQQRLAMFSSIQPRSAWAGVGFRAHAHHLRDGGWCWRAPERKCSHVAWCLTMVNNVQ